MNKLILISILSKYIELYLKEELDINTIEKIFQNEKYEEINENKIILKETELIVFLYKKIPYYKIKIFLNDFSKKLEEENNKTNNIRIKTLIKLLDGYLLDLKSLIKERTKTEIDYHLLLIAKDYYNGTLDIKKHSSIIRKNLCDPKELLSLDIAQNNDYEQITLFNLTRQETNLRDEISKSNYNKKTNIKKRIIKFITSTFTIEEYKQYLRILYKILEATEEIVTKEEAIQLYSIYEKEITMLYRELHHNLKSKEKRNEEIILAFKRSVY